MIITKKIDEIIDIITKYKDIEYRIINNTVGKNLILLDIRNDELLNELKEYDKYIQEIIIEANEDKDDFYIKEIKEICPEKNSFIHRNISYISWNRKLKNVQKINNVISGYSFKGGMGRSTTLAYLAYFYYLIGKKVVVLDSDFEAPGISSMFFEKDKREEKGGVLDYLIDLNIEEKPKLKDYYLEKNKSDKNGHLYLFPSGIDFNTENYINRISKIDFNSQKYINDFTKLINNINDNLKPDLIFIDLRAGINESNGFILRNLSNMNFLFFNSEEQNEDGLKVILNSLKDILNYHIINSTIRYRDREVREIKEKDFEDFINILKPNIKLLKVKFYQEMLDNKMEYFTNSQYNLYNANSNFEMQDIINIISKEYFYEEEKSDIKIILGKLQTKFEKLTADNKFTIEEDFKYFYIKDDIKLLLNEQKFLILGNKGSGKSTLFEVLKKNYEPLISQLNTNNKYIIGFSKDFSVDISSDYFNIISNNTKKDEVIFERFWKFITLYLLEKELSKNDKLFNSYGDIIDNILDLNKSLESDKRLKNINIELIQSDKIYTFLYDDLDLAIPENLREIFILNLIKFWQLNIYKYSNIKSKIFLRIDIFDKLNIEDKTHLDINILTLKWNKKEILSLIFKVIIATLSENEINILNLNNIVKSYKNFEITSDIKILNSSIYILLGTKINITSLIMDEWIIKYLSDTNRVITPRTIYSFIFETISNELNKLPISSNNKIIFQNFSKDYKEIIEQVSKNRLYDYLNEHRDYEKHINKIKDMGYSSFTFEDFKSEYKNIKDETVKNYLLNLEKSGFLRNDKQTKKYRLAEIYAPCLKLKNNKRVNKEVKH